MAWIISTLEKKKKRKPRVICRGYCRGDSPKNQAIRKALSPSRTARAEVSLAADTHVLFDVGCGYGLLGLGYGLEQLVGFDGDLAQVVSRVFGEEHGALGLDAAAYAPEP